MKYEFISNPVCTVCGGVKRIYLGRRVPRTLSISQDLVTEIFQCANCQFVYPDPFPQSDFEQTEENYSDPEHYFGAPIDEDRLEFCRKILTRIESLLGRKGRLLDLGSGRGELLHVAQSAGWTVLGVEPSRPFATFAESQFGVTVIPSFIDEAPLPEEGFDVVTMLSVLENSPRPVQLLGSTLKWLRRGGLIYLETTNQSGLVLRAGDLYYRLRGIRQTARLRPTFPSFQVVGYTPLTMQKLFGNLNCEVIESKCEANGDMSHKLRQGNLRDRILGRALGVVNFISGITGTGAVMTTVARLK